MSGQRGYLVQTLSYPCSRRSSRALGDALSFTICLKTVSPKPAQSHDLWLFLLLPTIHPARQWLCLQTLGCYLLLWTFGKISARQWRRDGVFLVCAAAHCSYQPPWPVRKHHQLAVGKQKSFNPQGLWVGCQGVLSSETQQQRNMTSACCGQ